LPTPAAALPGRRIAQGRRAGRPLLLMGAQKTANNAVCRAPVMKYYLENS
jgi:hypothetical protein